MKISRRDFIHAGCVVAAASLLPNPVEAAIHGSITSNPNRVTMNAIPTFANLAKGWSLPGQDPTTVSSDGYLINAPSSSIGGNMPLPSGYYGQYVWKWNGAASMQFAGFPAIVYSGGTFCGLTGASGQVTANFGILAGNGSNPRVVFKFGGLIASVSGGNGSLVTITTANALNFSSGLSTGSNVTLATGVSSNLANGPNSDGSWTITNVSSTQFTLNNSTGVINPTVTGSGGVGVQSEAVLGNFSVNPSIINSGTFASWSGLVFCKAGSPVGSQWGGQTYEQLIANGQINDPDYVNQIVYLMNQSSASSANRGWLRFMDMSNVQGSYESDFTNRLPSTFIAYSRSDFYRTAWWASGGINNPSSDGATFTCNTGRTGAYQDSEIIQGIFSATNTGLLPTLNDNSRGAVPVFNNNIDPLILSLSGGSPSPGTDHLVFTFSASWLNGGSAYTFTYPTVSGDGNEGTLSANLYNALVSDSTLTAAALHYNNNGNGVVVLPRTAQAGALTVTYTSGPAICSIKRLSSGAFTNGSKATFVYNQMLGGFIFLGNQGFNVSYPFEQLVELCNQSGSHLWFNWPLYTQGSFITAATNFIGDSITGLTSGLRFGTEVGNELWNSFQAPFSHCRAFANCLNLSSGSQDANETPQWSWGALRCVEYMSLSQSAWTGKGRALSDHYILLIGRQSEAFPNQNFQIYGLNGSKLTTSNSIYATYGGLGGGAGTDYSTAGNRPADLITATGMAMYWYSDYLRETAYSGGSTDIFGSVSDNATWLQAALDYANGNTSSAFSALVTMFNTHRGSASIASGTYNNSTGQISLTLASTLNNGTLAVGDIVHPLVLTTTGGSVSSVTSNGYTTITGTGGTTVIFNAASGLGSGITITGGVLVDETAGGVNPSQAANWASCATIFFANFEGIVSGYDTSRASAGKGKLGILHYEGAPQWSLSTSAVNGTNSASDAESLAALQYRIGAGGTTPGNVTVTGLNWNVAAYTVSGTNSASEMAQMVLNLTQGWKNDTDHTGAAANTSSYKNMVKTYYYQALVNASAGKGREVKAAQYGYQANIWGLFPTNYELSHYTNYDAIHEFNVGN